MATKVRFAYEAIDTTTRARTQDVVLAVSEAEARATLKASGLRPLKVTRETSKANFTIPGTGGPKMKPMELAEFTSMLAQMHSADVSIPEALSIVCEETSSKANVAMLTDIGAQLTEGHSLTEAFGAYPQVFGPVFTGYLAAGEATGEVPETLTSLAAMLDKQAAMRGKIRTATAPARWVGGIMGVMVAGILLFLVPMFQKIYASFNAELPAPTKVVVFIGNHLLPVGSGFPFIKPLSFSTLAFAIYAAIWWFRHRYKNNPEVWNRVTRITYRVPVFGALAREWALYGWFSTLGGALGSGLPMAKSLELAAQASGSACIAHITPHMVTTVVEGHELSTALATHKDLFPGPVRAMLRAGERVGRLAGALERMAKNYSEGLDRRVEGLKAAMEPLLNTVLGAIAGPLIIALYLPIIGMGSAMSKGLGG